MADIVDDGDDDDLNGGLDAAPVTDMQPTKRKARLAPRSGPNAKKSHSKPVIKAANAVEAAAEPKPKTATPKIVAGVESRQLILHDSRVLTNKGKELLRVQWSEANKVATRDKLMMGMIQAAQKKFGTSKVFGSRAQIEQLAIGIPVPSLAFEYLIGNDIFPFCMVMLAGQWGTCKSALLYEIFRWFYEQGGWPFHTDTEFKFDADFACSIMRAAASTLPVTSARASSLEEMQRMLTHFLKESKSICTGSKEEPGPGKTVPMCFGIDSLVGAASEEVSEKIMTKGNADRSFPIAALKNSGYLTAIKREFDGWPFSLVIVNHLKQQTTDSGDKQDYTPGGQAFNFHESFEIHTSKWRSNISNGSFEGVGIRLKCAKNSFGPTGRKIKTRFIWWIEDDADGHPHDKHIWDWEWALCTLLNETQGVERQRLRDRGLLLTAKSPAADVECMANFPAIGMSKKDFLPFQDVGRMIQQDPAVCDLIRDALNIKRRHSLGSMSFDQIEKAHKKRIK